MKKVFVTLLLAAISVCLSANDTRIPVIFDTDMGNDVDDAIALALLHEYIDNGKVELLGIPTTNYSEHTLEYLGVLNAWYGHPDIPLGSAIPGHGISKDKFVGEVCLGHTALKRANPEILPSVELYRKALAGARDHSVVIISVGYNTNLAALLESRPDVYSRLDGYNLVKKKVKMVVTMMGNFQKPEAEWNVVGDLPASQKFISEWPTDIVVTPFELGAAARFSGERMEKLLSLEHPVALAYAAFKKMPYDRPSWDITAVQYAVEGPAMFTVSPKGRVSMEEKGVTTFDAGRGGRHIVLSAKPEQAAALVAHQASFFPGPGLKHVEASSLTLVGKMFPDTPNPYHRADTSLYKGLSKEENMQMRCASGIAVAFRTNSTRIQIVPEYGEFVFRPSNATDYAYVGFDLYMKDASGRWLWAACKCNDKKREKKPVELIGALDGSMHECIMYLPIYSELYSVKIGVDEDSLIEPLDNPFAGRIGIFGSSFTQGISCSRAGMSYPMQLGRMSGYQFCSIAAAGNCKMQDYFAQMICDSDCDAFVFDCFSNPSPEIISERLEPFIVRIRSAHPDAPLIFQQTIYRENRNFMPSNDRYERRKQETAASLMKQMCRKYPGVYFIRPCATSDTHETSVDGVHPGDYGYTLWAESIRKDVVRILRKHK